MAARGLMGLAYGMAPDSSDDAPYPDQPPATWGGLQPPGTASASDLDRWIEETRQQYQVADESATNLSTTSVPHRPSGITSAASFRRQIRPMSTAVQAPAGTLWAASGPRDILEPGPPISIEKAAVPEGTGNPYGETLADFGRLRHADVVGMAKALPPRDAEAHGQAAGAVRPDPSSRQSRNAGYDPNDVRGGFEANGDSSAYHPRSYDPTAASAWLLALAAAGVPTAESLFARLEMGRLTKDELLAIVKEGTPALRKIFGSDIDGALAGLKKPVYDSGLTRMQANAYRERIARKLPEYEADDNFRALQLQELRFQILNNIGK